MIEIISFSSSLSDTRNDRISPMTTCNIMDEFLHDNGLPDSCTTEESDFAPLEHRSNEIDHLDPRLEYFCLGRELLE